jgi:hypothetical protein
MQVQSYCIHDREQIENQYREMKMINGFMKIESGARSENYSDSVLIMPVEEIVILAISNVAPPSSIIRPPSDIKVM